MNPSNFTPLSSGPPDVLKNIILGKYFWKWLQKKENMSKWCTDTKTKKNNLYFKSISETFANISQHLPLADEQISNFYASIGILNPKKVIL